MPNPKGNPATLKKFQPKWRSGQTQTIRVPVAIAQQVLEYAHLLDEQQALLQVNECEVSQSPAENWRQRLSYVVTILENVCQTPNTSKFTKVLNQRIKYSAIEPLKDLLQVNEK